MAKRCIYFIRDNILYKKTVEVCWDADAMVYNKVSCSDELFKSALQFMHPCIDVSPSSEIWRCRSLCSYQVKDINGLTVNKMVELLESSTDKEYLPPGSYDLLYIKSLNDKQFNFALSVKSFYDIYFNPEKNVFSPAKALAVLQLLYNQDKLDYIYDMKKFLHWYYINARNPVEWVNKYEEVN